MQKLLQGIEPDFKFYSETYHGTVGEAAFATALPDALAEVSYAVRPDVSLTAHTDRIMMAVCAVVDAVGNTELRRTSYKAGDVSESFGNPGFSLTAEAAIRRWLGGTGVLKRGRWL